MIRKISRNFLVIVGWKLAVSNKNFCECFEDAVRASIDKYNMIADGDRLLVAYSGGVDSAVLLYEMCIRDRYYQTYIYKNEISWYNIHKALIFPFA